MASRVCNFIGLPSIYYSTVYCNKWICIYSCTCTELLYYYSSSRDDVPELIEQFASSTSLQHEHSTDNPTHIIIDCNTNLFKPNTKYPFRHNPAIVLNSLLVIQFSFQSSLLPRLVVTKIRYRP
jgi:hypothetical protein